MAKEDYNAEWGNVRISDGSPLLWLFQRSENDRKSVFSNVKKRIVDQFTQLPVSRQRKWQLRQRQKGLCAKCSKRVVPESIYCIRHMVDHRVAARRRYQRKRGRTRQHRGTKSLARFANCILNVC